MANPEHVKMLLESTAEQWNAWRDAYPNVKPNLYGVELSREFLQTPKGCRGAFLSLHGRNLRDTSLACSDFEYVDVGDADFTSADLDCVWFDRAHCSSDAGPTGLDQVLSRKLEYPRCDEHCSERGSIFAYPKDCARRCSDVLSPNGEHISWLLDGVEAWNEWRKAEPNIDPNLSGLDVHSLFEMEKGIDKRDVVDLSGINFEYASLRGTKFHEIKLNRTKCYGADLRCSKWNGVEANGSNFMAADFRNAKIDFSRLSGCDFRSAQTSGLSIEASRLPGANLSRTDLRGDSFVFSDLTSSDLSGAHVCGSTFVEAVLAGTNLDRTRIWKADLFKPEIIDRIADVGEAEPQTIPDLASLFRVVAEVREAERRSDGPRVEKPLVPGSRAIPNELFYRGHDSAGLCLNPTIAREERYLRNEAEMMDSLLSKHPEEFRQDTVFFQRLVRARHFELPSRLLDVTSDAQTALYYATNSTPPDADGFLQIFIVEPEMVYPFDSDTVSLVSNFSRLSHEQQSTLLTKSHADRSGWETRTDMERHWTQSPYKSAMKRLIHFIAREKPYWEDRIRPADLFKVLLVKPEFSFPRLKAHGGAFLMSAYHESFDPMVVNLEVPGSGKYRRVTLRVPADAKVPIRRELRLAGVTEESLRSDLGSTAKAIKDEILAPDVP